jgi:hypothetical protein
MVLTATKANTNPWEDITLLSLVSVWALLGLRFCVWDCWLFGWLSYYLSHLASGPLYFHCTWPQPLESHLTPPVLKCLFHLVNKSYWAHVQYTANTWFFWRRPELAWPEHHNLSPDYYNNLLIGFLCPCSHTTARNPAKKLHHVTLLLQTF